jgi:rubrerythrin
MSTPNLLDAIRVVKENERLSSERYAEAADHTNNPLGKKLFEQLSEFEKYHYERISLLEKSLQEKGDYIKYEGKEFPLPPIFVIKAAEEPKHKSLMKIITLAIELEKTTEKVYADLAAQITDLEGHHMFSQLSEEEHKHYLLLRDAYWNLNNQGIWNYTRP